MKDGEEFAYEMSSLFFSFFMVAPVAHGRSQTRG